MILLKESLPVIKLVKRFRTEEGVFSVWDVDDDHRDRGDMFTVLESKTGWIVRNMLVPESMRRQGIALSFHIRMNDLSKRKTGKPLRTVPPRFISGRMYREFSDDAEKLWDRMVLMGIAVKIDYKNYIMT